MSANSPHLLTADTKKRVTKKTTIARANVDAQTQFDRLARKYFDWVVRQYPEYATILGIHEFDERLTNYAPKAVSDRQEKIREFVAEFKAVPARGLDLNSKVERHLLVEQLEMQIMLERNWAPEERDPSMFIEAGVYGCYSITIRDVGDAPIAAQKMTQRMLGIPRMLAQGRKLINKPTRVNCEVAIASGAGAIAFFKDTVAKFAKRVKDSKIRQAMREAAQAAEEAVSSYVRWIKEDLLPEASDDFAIGSQLFNSMLKKNHQLDIDTDELLKLGWRQYHQSITQLEAIANHINSRARSKFTWEELVDVIKRDHPTNSELVQYYSDEMKRAKRFVIENRLVDIPEQEKIEVVQTPEFARPVIPYAAYMAPAPFEAEQRGTFWVTPVDKDKSPEEMEKQLRDHCTHGIVVTALHEAYPGHHLQVTVGNQYTERPLRILLGTTVFVEGWALYCEQMMWEQGFYDDLRSRLLQLKDQLWRACRVIIDVSIHTGEMTYQQAIDFLVDKAMLELPNAQAEVLRYARTPTQPMSYIVGKLQVLEVLEDYKRKRGSAFNLRQFHNEFISYGSLPIKQIRLLMDLPQGKPVKSKAAK